MGPNAPTAVSLTKFNNSARLISELNLQKPPSCIQFVPLRNFPNYLVVGTYELEPEESADQNGITSMDEDEDHPKVNSSTPQRQNRNGSIFLIEYADSQLSIVHEYECPSAVYDLHFLEDDTATFVTASSTGTISFYFVGRTQDVLKPQIKHLWTSQVFDPDTVITYFCIIRSIPSPTGSLIAATTNTGGVYLMSYSIQERSVKLLNDGIPITQYFIPRTNSMPDNVWCCASIAHNLLSDGLKILSGSDSGTLNCDTIPVYDDPNCYGFTKRPPRVVHSFHTEGVTAILPLGLTPNESVLILTGCYDGHVRLYSLSSKKVLADIDLGGGVYRLKLVRQYLIGKFSYIVLATCMYAGTKAIEVDIINYGGEYEIKVVASLGVPESDYSYAADFQPLDVPDHHDYKQLCVSGTWLGRKLSVWEYDCKADDRT